MVMALTSGGVDIYHYCCDACAEYGHNIFRTISCEEVHALHHCDELDCVHCGNHTHRRSAVSENSKDLCSHLASKAKHCDVHHINAPQLQTHNSVDFKISLPVADMLFYDNIVSEIYSETTEKEYRFLADPPLFIDGRAIIVLKNSYLI